MASITKIKNPSNPWRVYIRRVGHPDISKLFPTHVEAKRWARAEEAKLDKNPTANAGADLTLSSLIAIYNREFVPNERDKDNRIFAKVHLLRFIDRTLGHHQLRNLSLNVFRDYAKQPRARTPRAKNENKKPLSGKTIKSKLKTIALVLNHAGVFANAKAQCASVAADIATVLHELKSKNLLHSASRDRRPTEAELLKLEALFNKPSDQQCVPMWDLILFAMSTCMRRGEITKIVWEDFDPIDRTIWIRDRKDPTGGGNRHDECPLLKGTFEWRGVPVDPIAIMMRQPSAAARTGRVFPYSREHASRLFRYACKDLNIPNLHFHDLRHEGVSRLFEDGRPMEQVSVVSGHRSWTDLKRYTNLKPKNLHRDTVTP